MRRGRRVVAALVAAVAVVFAAVGCSSSPRAPSLPDGIVTGLEWAADGSILVAVSHGSGPADELFRSSDRGRSWQSVAIPPVGECHNGGSISTLFRRGGQVGLAVRCGTDVTTLMTIAPDGTDPRTLATVDQRVVAVGWFDDGNTGYVATGALRCLGIGRLVDGALVDLPATIATEDGPLAVQANFRDAYNCAGRGDAGWPAAGGPGPDLYFIGQPTAATKVEAERASSPGQVYRLTDPRATPVVVADDVTRVQDLSLAPGGDRLVFSGWHGGAPGLWTIEVPTGMYSPVAAGDYGLARFSPDGAEVAAVTLSDPQRLEFRSR